MNETQRALFGVGEWDSKVELVRALLRFNAMKALVSLAENPDAFRKNAKERCDVATSLSVGRNPNLL